MQCISPKHEWPRGPVLVLGSEGPPSLFIRRSIIGDVLNSRAMVLVAGVLGASLKHLLASLREFPWIIIFYKPCDESCRIWFWLGKMPLTSGWCKPCFIWLMCSFRQSLIAFQLNPAIAPKRESFKNWDLICSKRTWWFWLITISTTNYYHRITLMKNDDSAIDSPWESGVACLWWRVQGAKICCSLSFKPPSKSLDGNHPNETHSAIFCHILPYSANL